MAIDNTKAKAILLNDGVQQILPVSKATLVELAVASKTNFDGADNVQEALTYVAGAFSHANTVAAEAQANAYAYVAQEINNLDVAAVGSATSTGHDKFISYIYQENGYIHAFAQNMTAANVAYSNTTVEGELTSINEAISDLQTNGPVTLVKVVDNNGTSEEQSATTVAADGDTYRLKQHGAIVAEFNIERDSFVQSGVARQATAADVTAAAAQSITISEGQWIIVLTVNPKDQQEKDIYIPAEALVDAYTSGSQAGDMVVVGVDSQTNKITATITDGTVTRAKLASDVTSSLAAADYAVQDVTLNGTSIVSSYTAALTIGTGSANGTISVNNSDVAVKGLLNIAYTGAASDVSVDTSGANNAIAALVPQGGTNPDDVQEALELIASKVKSVADGAVTSVVTSVTDNGHDADNLVTISMTPTTAADGDVTIALTHNLGGLASLDYTVVNSNAEAYSIS